MDERARIALRNVSFAYPDAGRPALRGVSFDVREGELAVVCGRNGSGKSTLAMMVNGTIPHLLRGEFSGEARLDGAPVAPPRESARLVGVVFQDFEAHLVSSTAALEVAFPMENHGVDRARQRVRVGEALEGVGLGGFEPRVPAELSGGEKQRLAIAAAVAMEPGVLVLDEPLTDLDPAGKLKVLEAVRRLNRGGITVLMVEHELQALLAADRALVLDAGELVYDGPPAVLLRDPGRCARHGVPAWPPVEVAAAFGVTVDGLSIDDVAAKLEASGVSRRDAAPAEPPAPAAGPPALEFSHVTSGYPDAPDILKDVSLTVHAGECVALLGQNGSGKTSLAKHAVGLLRVKRGELRVFGEPASSYTLARLSRRIGYVFQNPDHQIFADTVVDEVAFGARNLGLQPDAVARQTREALAAVDLVGREGEDPFSLTKGERQRLAVASLLAYRPEALIFDEPTTGLDAEEAERMLAFINRLNGEGTTVILITHAMWAAAACARRTVVMAGGRVVLDGPTAEVLGDRESLGPLGLAPPPVLELAGRFGLRELTVPALLGRLGRRPGEAA